MILPWQSKSNEGKVPRDANVVDFYLKLIHCSSSQLIRLLLDGFDTIGNTTDGNKFSLFICYFNVPDMFKITF